MSLFFYITTHLLVLAALVSMALLMLRKTRKARYKGDRYAKPIAVFIAVFIYVGMRNLTPSYTMQWLDFMVEGRSADMIFLGILVPIILGVFTSVIMILPSNPKRVFSNRLVLFLLTWILCLYIDIYVCSFFVVAATSVVPNVSFALSFLLVIAFGSTGKRIKKSGNSQLSKEINPRKEPHLN